MLTCYSSHSGDQKWDLKPNLNIFTLPVLSHVGGTRSRARVVLFALSWNLTCLTPWVCMPVCVCACVSNFSPLKVATCRPKNEPWLAMRVFGFSIPHRVSSPGSRWDCVQVAVCVGCEEGMRRRWCGLGKGCGSGSLEGCVVWSTARYPRIGIPMSGVKKARLLAETPFLRQTPSAKSRRTHFQKLLLMWAHVNHPHRQLSSQHPPLLSIWNSHTLRTRGENFSVSESSCILMRFKSHG